MAAVYESVTRSLSGRDKGNKEYNGGTLPPFLPTAPTIVIDFPAPIITASFCLLV